MSSVFCFELYRLNICSIDLREREGGEKERLCSGRGKGGWEGGRLKKTVCLG